MNDNGKKAAPGLEPETRPETNDAGRDSTSRGEWKFKLPMAVHSSLDDAGLTAEQFRVMAAVCRKCGDEANGRQCDASILTLAKICRLHPQTVRDALISLKALGWVDVIERSGRSKVHVPRFPYPSGSKVGVSLQGRGMVEVEGLGFEVAPPSGSELGPPSGFKVGKGIPTRETHKGNHNLPPHESLPFASEAFAEAWGEWLQHRKEKKKPVTPLSAKKSLSELAKIGEDRAIAAINLSIASGWQGIFETNHSSQAAKPMRTIDTGGRKASTTIMDELYPRQKPLRTVDVGGRKADTSLMDELYPRTNS